MDKLLITVVGRDRPGIVAYVSSTLSEYNANILKARAHAFLDLFIMTMLVDVTQVRPLANMLNTLKDGCEKHGLGIAIEDARQFSKHKKLIALDMDGTIVDAELINELARARGVEDEVAKITKAAMDGELNFEEALRKRVALLKGLPISEVYKLRDKIPLTKSAHDVIQALKNAGFITVLITGSFDIFANYIAEKLGFDYVFCNKLVVKNGRLTGEIEGEILSPEAKLNALRKVAEKEGISLDECVAVGDGANDLLIIKNVGLGIAFNPKKIVKKEANAIVSIKDLKVLLAILAGESLKGEIKKRL